MSLFVFGIILVVAGVIALGAGLAIKLPSDNAQGRRFYEKRKKITSAIGVGVIAVGAICVISSGIRTVEASHTGVVTVFGSIQDNTLDAGIHVTVPWSKVTEIDNRTQKQTLDLSCFSSDIQEVSMVYTVNYLVPSIQSKSIYAQYGADYYNVIITPNVQQIVKEHTAEYTAENLVSSRSELGEKIADDLSKALEKYGIELVNGAIENLDFTDEFTAAVESKQVAEQQKLQAQIDAERQVIEAQAAADAKVKTAQGNAQSELIEAEAKAQANELIEKSLTENVLRYQMLQIWDGKLPAVISDGNNIFDITGFVQDTTAQ